MDYTGQIGQDYFVRTALKGQRNGTFLEIGSQHPTNINNSYGLERDLGWRGIMVEWDARYEPLYKQHRPTAIHVMSDATTVNYLALLERNNFPNQLGYLQIDLEVDNQSTIQTLEHIDKTVFPTHTFATVTFEHDIYRGDFFNTRIRSRDIFQRNGYELLFPDVSHDGNSFEDWWVHPSLVDMDRMKPLQRTSAAEYTDVLNSLHNLNRP